MKVYDVSGRHIRTLVSKDMEAGDHKVLWDGKNSSGSGVASGVYFYRIIAGQNTATKKMVLLR